MGGLRLWQCRSRYRRGAAAVVLFLLAWLAGTCLLHRWLSIDPDGVRIVHSDQVPQRDPNREPSAAADNRRAEPEPAAQVTPPEDTEAPQDSPVERAGARQEPSATSHADLTEPTPSPSVESPHRAAPISRPAEHVAERPKPTPVVRSREPERQSPVEKKLGTEQPVGIVAEMIPAPKETEAATAHDDRVGGDAQTTVSIAKAASHFPAPESVPANLVPTGHQTAGPGPQQFAGPGIPKSSGIVQVGCSACGGSGLLGPGGDDYPGEIGGCGCCGAGACVVRRPCYPCDGSTKFSRFLCGVYQCICCPDPCYEGRWRAVGNAAFFVDPIRPQTQQRVRWDAGFDMIFPDRAEFFWAKQNVPGPLVPPPFLGEKRLAYDDLSVYTEVSAGLISFFIELPYRSLDPELLSHAAGFSDMNLGTKTLLYDCELFQLTFQLRTYLPTGNFAKGLGTGHVSLEPSILLGINIAPDSYLQTQVAEWIPLGGDPGYAGALLHYHVSFNQVLWRPVPNVPLIGTMEFNGWSFQNGSYTDPVLGPYQQASGETYVSLGPGLRLVICDKADFGVGTAFAVTRGHWADELFRSELRWRF